MKLSKVIKHLHHSLPLFSWGDEKEGERGVQNENFERRHSEAAGGAGPRSGVQAGGVTTVSNCAQSRDSRRLWGTPTPERRTL